MAQRPVLCTVQDVRNLDEYTSTFVLDDARVLQCIHRADSVVRNILRPLYTDAQLLESTPWNGPPQSPFALPDHGIAANTGTGRLVDVTLGSNAVTELITVTFTSSTAYAVTGTITGSMSTGSTAASYTNSYLTLPTSAWSGTFANGDIWRVAVYTAKPLIVTLVSLMAAQFMVSSVYHSDESKSKATALKKQFDDLIDRITHPYEDGGIQLDSFSPRDITPEGVAFNINFLGYDNTIYAANPLTNDPGTGNLCGFFSGPIWLR